MEKDNRIPVIWGLDKKYILQAFVVIRSILLNSKEMYHFLILTADNIEDEVTEYTDILKSEYNNFEVSVRMVDINCFSDARIYNAHLSKAAYFRLLIPELVPEYDKCIYLDCDLIVHGDLRELYAVELEGNYLAGVKDCHVIEDNPYEIEHQRVLGLPTRDKYINSGVLVINLKKIREDDVIPRFHEQLKKENWYEDQDVLNYCCYPLIKILPLQYNLFHFYLGRNIKFIYHLPYEFDFNHDRPFILHMGGRYKPWSNFEFSGSDEWWQIADVFSESESYHSYRKTCKEAETQKEIREIVKRAEESEHVVVWGYSEYGMKLCDILLEFQLNNVVAIADNNEIEWGEVYRGIPVKGPDSIIEKYDNIFWLISCQVSYPEVIEQLKNSGVNEDNILRYVNRKIKYKDKVYLLALHEDAFDRKLARIFGKGWDLF